MKTLGAYIRDLESSKDERDPQVKDGLEIYLGLWKRAIENGFVSESDPLEDALAKIEEKGGLYEAGQ